MDAIQTNVKRSWTTETRYTLQTIKCGSLYFLLNAELLLDKNVKNHRNRLRLVRVRVKYRRLTTFLMIYNIQDSKQRLLAASVQLTYLDSV